MWALSVSCPPPAPTQGWRAAASAQPFLLLTRPAPLRTERRQRGQIGALLSTYTPPPPQPGTLDSVGSQAPQALPEKGAVPWGPR